MQSPSPRRSGLRGQVSLTWGPGCLHFTQTQRRPRHSPGQLGSRSLMVLGPGIRSAEGSVRKFLAEGKQSPAPGPATPPSLAKKRRRQAQKRRLLIQEGGAGREGLKYGTGIRSLRPWASGPSARG